MQGGRVFTRFLSLASLTFLSRRRRRVGHYGTAEHGGEHDESVHDLLPSFRRVVVTVLPQWGSRVTTSKSKGYASPARTTREGPGEFTPPAPFNASNTTVLAVARLVVRLQSADHSTFPSVKYRADLVLLRYEGKPVYGGGVVVASRSRHVTSSSRFGFDANSLPA